MSNVALVWLGILSAMAFVGVVVAIVDVLWTTPLTRRPPDDAE